MDAVPLLPAYSNDLEHYTVPTAVPNCCELTDYDPVAIDARSFYSSGMPYCHKGHVAAVLRWQSSDAQQNRYGHRCSRSPGTFSSSLEYTNHHSSVSNSSDYLQSQHLSHSVYVFVCRRQLTSLEGCYG